MTSRALLSQERADADQALADLQNNPVCAVFFDAEVPCLTVVWKRYPTSAQLRSLHEKLLDLIRKHGVSKILGDDTALPAIDPEDQAWIVRNWLPRAAAAGLKAAANKNPEAHFGRVAVENFREAQRFLSFRSFEDFEEARRWLRNVAA
jgi:hypothetical protein